MERIYDFLFILFSPLCHQICERSFQDLYGHQFFVCARDTGTYLGFLFSWVFYFIFNKKSFSFPILLIVILFFIHFFLFGLDGLTSYMNLRETSNIVRYFTGFFVGFYLGQIFQFIRYFLFDNEKIKREFSKKEFIKSFFILEFGALFLFVLTSIFIKYLLFVLAFAIIFYFYQLIKIVADYVFLLSYKKFHYYLALFLGFAFIFLFLFITGINKASLIENIYAK